MRVFIIPVLVAIALTGCTAGSSAIHTSDALPVDCLVKPNHGPCQSAETRFYYDYRDDRCKAFTYGGCKGRIPFRTQKECSEHCIAGH